MLLAHSSYGDPAGRPLVLVGSLGSRRSMWDRLIPALHAGYRIIPLDLRGHGASAVTPAPYSMSELADDVVDTLDHLALDRADIVGISIGGMIALQLALDARDRVRTVAVCDASAGPLPQEVWNERVQIVEAGGLAGLAPAVASRWMTEAGRARLPAVFDELVQGLATCDPIGYAGAAAAVRDFDVSGRLGEITTPTVVIIGEVDQSLPMPHSEAVQAGIKGAELVILGGLAHLPAVEDPAAFAKALEEFLQRH